MNKVHPGNASGSSEMELESIERTSPIPTIGLEREYPDDLHAAARHGQADRLRRLLVQVTPQKMNQKDWEMRTPLHYAARYHHVECVNILIDKGADVNIPDEDGATPLHHTADDQTYEGVDGRTTDQGGVERETIDATVKLLVSEGADVNSEDSGGLTPLHYAARRGNTAAATALLECEGIEINCMDKRSYYQDTPLHIAAYYGYVEIVELLVTKGADIAAVKNEHMTPLHIAARADRHEVCEILIQRGAPLECRDVNGCTPLLLCAKCGHVAALETLLNYSAYISCTDCWGRNAIYLASQNNIEVLEALLKHLGVAAKDLINQGCSELDETALHVAAEKGHVRIIESLLNHGGPRSSWDADEIINRKSYAGRTPLHFASSAGHTKVVELLLKWKAEVSPRSKYYGGDNCLDVAIDTNHEDVAVTIVNSDQWRQALWNQTDMCNTTLRKLIRKMPEVALRVFHRCTGTNDLPPGDPKYRVTFNYELLDDTFVMPVSTDDGMMLHLPDSVYDDNKLKLGAEPYTKDRHFWKENHPLMILVSSEREDLLAHPLVTSLLRHKWKRCVRYIYYTNLVMYFLFLASLTTYILLHTDSEDWLLCNDITTVSNDLHEGVKFTLLSICSLHLIKEVYQLFWMKSNYFGWQNLIEWVIFGCPIYLALVQDCTELQDQVHYQVMAIAIFLAWINLLLFIRPIERLGIYIVMFTEVLKTFINFSFILFLFIIAFALSFHTLMANQIPFNTVGAALIKTLVMMTGEFEFNNMFNDRFDTNKTDEESAQVDYPVANYFIFVLFLVVMSIILMNLLVGLAVGDIKAVQDKAKLKRLSMKVRLVLEIESILFNCIRRGYAIRTLELYPNKRTVEKVIKNKLKMKSELSDARIRSALQPQSSQTHERLKRLENMTENNKNMIEEIDSNMKKVVSMIETMMDAHKH